MKKMFFSPSLMCADLLNMHSDVTLLEKAGFDSFHMDVMDFHFVPNITLGFDLINKFNQFKTPLDVHLMVENVPEVVNRLKTTKNDFITFHLEAPVNTANTINLIKEKSKAGLAISPGTSPEKIYPYISQIDLLLIMTVYPGFAGAAFVPESYDRAREIVRVVKRQKKDIRISVDGAIGFEQIKKFSDLGINMFVLGTKSLFKGNLKENAKQFRDFINTLK